MSELEKSKEHQVCACGHGYHQHHHRGDGGCIGYYQIDKLPCDCVKWNPVEDQKKENKRSSTRSNRGSRQSWKLDKLKSW